MLAVCCAYAEIWTALPPHLYQRSKGAFVAVEGPDSASHCTPYILEEGASSWYFVAACPLVGTDILQALHQDVVVAADTGYTSFAAVHAAVHAAVAAVDEDSDAVVEGYKLICDPFSKLL